MKAICNDLAAEHETLDSIVADIAEERWKEMTPFSGWSIHDEISHVAFFDYAGRLAATDSGAFAKHIEELTKGIETPLDMHRRALKKGRDMRPPKLLEWWQEERKAMLAAFEKRGPKDRLPWYGPSMSARSFVTARLMETWAHGQDVVDTLGVRREPTDRLKHIAHLGVVTFGWSFTTNGMNVPTQPVRIELKSPSGDIWTWGPEEAGDVVRGAAEEFCLAVVRRRHVDDTHLEITGDVAIQWMSIAQAFAGPPEKRPEPGSFPKLDI
jgi:uncharacterized protein (TIGR03084 family)